MTINKKRPAYDFFAKKYSDSMGEEGDYIHITQIDPYIYKIIGDPKDKIIYDLGCGNGYMARNLASRGAKVFASDISRELIKIAMEKEKGLNVNYSVRTATDFTDLSKGQFDTVIMNMVVNYVKNLNELFSGISDLLKINGILVFSTNHFLRPSYPYSEWIRGQLKGREKLFIKVTGYLNDIKFSVPSGWDNKTKLNLINRPLGKYVNTMSKYGLLTETVFEPESSGFAKDFSVKLQKSHHIPTNIIIGARKVR